jgi:hypothetical protein
VLTAAAAQGYRFEGWSLVSGCGGETTCTITAGTSSRTVGAAFRPAATLALHPNGRGSIAVSPPGLDLESGQQADRCVRENVNNGCRLGYLPGTRVSLAALPDPGSTFAGFSDFLCPLPTCQLELAAGERALSATFSPLELRIRMAGEGRVVSDPPGIDCRDDDGSCRASFPAYSRVVVTAFATTGGPPEWIAGCEPEGGNTAAARCATSVDSNPTWVVLRFGNADKPGIPDRVSVRLRVAKGGTGSGAVRGGGIDCGATCDADYRFGDRVTLQAQADTGSRFAGWVNGCGTTPACAFPVGPVLSLQALFERRAPLALQIVSVRQQGSGTGRRLVAVVRLGRAARLTLRLERGGRALASRAVSGAAGTRTYTLPIPRVGAGPARLVVTASAADGERAQRSRTVQVRR